jgi:SAM-dependent methyltransferase
MREEGEIYVGRRILEAMHHAVRYADTVFHVVQGAMPPSSRKVLDFGAGDGLFVERFRNRAVVVDAVEPDVNLRSRLESTGVTAFSSVYTVGDASYDFVYTINVLEHIENLEHVCMELFRVVRPDGKLFVFVPAFEILWTSLDDEVTHIQRFTRASLRKVLEQSGFVVEHTEYFDSLGFPAALGVRMLEKFNLFRYDGSTVGFYDQYLFPVSRRLDCFFRHILGKNVVAFAAKPS